MIEPAIARISQPEIGTTFAIDRDTALTAWHCLRDPDSGSRALPEVDLTFLNDTSITATFVHGDPLEDWAILRLTEPLPDTLEPVRLRTEVEAWEDCRCVGFPASTLLPGELGYLPILATLSGETVREGAKRLVLHGREVAAGLNPRGMSGGPVIPRSGPSEAVGIMSRLLVDEYGEDVGGALFACPAHLFADKPALAPTSRDEDISEPDLQRLSSRASEGDVAAAAQAGRILREGGEFDKAEYLLRQAATGGSASGAFELGLLLDPKGEALESDPARADEALLWFRKAALGGDVFGATTMGIRLHQRKQEEAAMHWLEDAVERGDAMAAHTLGTVFERKDEAGEGERWHRFAAERGDQAAARRMGQICKGRADIEQARRWLELAPNDEGAQAELHELQRADPRS